MNDFILNIYTPIITFLLFLFLSGWFFHNKKIVQLNKIKEMLENDISILEDKLVRLYALNNIDNNVDEIKELEFNIIYRKDLYSYIISKML